MKTRKEALLLPVHLKLDGRKVLIVGAGPVGAGKLAALRGTGARIQVVAPEVDPAFDQPGITVERREFVPEDLRGVWLVVAAAPPEVNRAVSEAAASTCTFVNAVDDPAPASAYLGGVVRRGGITLAISTQGLAPALAGLLREAFEALLPPEGELERWVAEARALRVAQKAAGTPLESRRPLLLQALNALYEQK